MVEKLAWGVTVELTKEGEKQMGNRWETLKKKPNPILLVLC